MNYETTQPEISQNLERQEAFNYLTKIGLFMTLAGVDVYHGRVARVDDETWGGVNPTIQNTKTDPGSNMLYRSALYAGSKETAQEFADTRLHELATALVRNNLQELAKNEDPVKWRNFFLDKWKEFHRNADPDKYFLKYSVEPPDMVSDFGGWSNYELFEVAREKMANGDQYPEVSEAWSKQMKLLRAEVYRIVSDDDQARVVDFSFSWKDLDDKELVRYKQALDLLMKPVLSQSSEALAQSSDQATFVDALDSIVNDSGLVEDTENALEIAKTFGLNMEEASEILGTFNTEQYAVPWLTRLVYLYIRTNKDITTQWVGNEGEEKPVVFNLGLVRRIFEELHIVGIKNTANSDTLGKRIEIISILDLHRINAVEKVTQINEQTSKTIGEVAVTNQ